MLAVLLVARAAALSSPAVRREGLVGSSHRVTLDFGRERNTWMPPRWAATTRAVFSARFSWQANGVVRVDETRPVRGLALGSGVTWDVDPLGTWTIDDLTLRVSLTHSGFAVGDCEMEPGALDLALPVFFTPDIILSSKEGLMSIIAYRFFVRRERRLVGVWHAESMGLSGD